MISCYLTSPVAYDVRVGRIVVAAGSLVVRDIFQLVDIVGVEVVVVVADIVDGAAAVDVAGGRSEEVLC